MCFLKNLCGHRDDILKVRCGGNKLTHIIGDVVEDSVIGRDSGDHSEEQGENEFEHRSREFAVSPLFICNLKLQTPINEPSSYVCRKTDAVRLPPSLPPVAADRAESGFNRLRSTCHEPRG